MLDALWISTQYGAKHLKDMVLALTSWISESLLTLVIGFLIQNFSLIHS